MEVSGGFSGRRCIGGDFDPSVVGAETRWVVVCSDKDAWRVYGCAGRGYALG